MTGRNNMNPISGMAGHFIRRLHQISVGAFMSRMMEQDIDLTQVQFAALSCIKEFPEIDQTSLAQQIACDRATTGGVIDRLEKKALVRRIFIKSDRRRKGLVITNDGLKIYETALPAVWVVQEDIMRGLTDDERIELLRLLAKATKTSQEFSRVQISPRAFPEISKPIRHPD